MLQVTRVLEFDAAHRLLHHESKCANLHGHRYKVEITAEKAALDSIGRVIDFAVLKEKIGGWLDLNWDHNVLLFEKDVETVKAVRAIPQQKAPFIAPWNPTAENMADYLLHHICPELLKETGVTVTKVIVWETPNCKAEANLRTT